MPPTSRRVFLAGTLTATGAGVLAACSGSAGGNGATPSPSPGVGAASGEALVPVGDVPVGGAVGVTTSAGDELIVAQPEEGTFVGFSAICTHMGCIVEPEGEQLVCPCHGSVYRTATGENIDGPAPRPLDEVAVEVSDGQVVVA